VTYIVVDRRDDYCADHEQPISKRNEYLAVNLSARMGHFDLRKVAQVHNLNQKLECAGDHGLRCNDGCKYGDDEGRIEGSWRNGIEERVRVGRRIVGNKGSLANVGQK